MLEEIITVKKLAEKIKINITKLIQYFLKIGIKKNINDSVNIIEKKNIIQYLISKNKYVKNQDLSINKTYNKKHYILNKYSTKFKQEKKHSNFIDITQKEYKKFAYKKKITNKKYFIKNKEKNIKRNTTINYSTLQQNFQKPIKNINRTVCINNKNISINDLSNKMAVKSSLIIQTMTNMGEKVVNINQLLNQETAQFIAEEMGHKVILHDENSIEKSLINKQENNKYKKYERSPIVTVMGHVDHGKTSLLNYILSNNIIKSEAGNITQNINAYQIKHQNKYITFVDTPGHAAFKDMRFRGIQITDIIILVIAIDDGVMPQTVEVINYAKKLNIPIIVAINKIDKDISNIDKITNELSSYHIVSEKWGGDNIFVSISAKTGIGINKLLDAILLQAEILELKVRYEGIAKGTVIESYLDKGKGPVANILVQEGKLSKGDIILCGITYGRIKSLRNNQGLIISYATPSMPIEIIGLSDIPYAGDIFITVKNEKQAKAVAIYRKNKLRENHLQEQSKNFRQNFDNLNIQNNICRINILLKCHSQGSVEIIKNILINMSNNHCKINVIHTGVGNITETDVTLITTKNNNHVIIIGFNVKTDNAAKNIILSENIKIKNFTVIYHLIQELQDYINILTIPQNKYKILGIAEVKNIFTIPKLGVIAGCTVINGILKNNDSVHIIRNNKVIYEGVIESLRRFKDTVNEVHINMECGISIKNFNTIKIKDKIETFK
ncbi:translation initiation factor IF-2 [Enterobacteriaceae endosymbiont of Neohaemonia nigricornis]|uniref:translation initiation factor IF-2 n=1 Tax=Enterobacteriaceae endosymbiont of Neohaemonia nigricornis TaxID=2675792 RepID=UPI001449FD3B|nr:translation initiation factor IF-2 [Enterobacteriaceae endosymbiont of Neohaemonia nigricornis]QJC30498.1 translation initiation factor IF-2 [Enterobacteriaceae endosymbiont of Neohaemonia nigricornis]